MEKQLSENIVSRVKSKLCLTDPLMEVTVVYEKLCQALVQSHPDLFSDESAKKIAEERFKELNSMREELKAYMEQQSAEGQLVLYDANAELTTLHKVTKVADQEVEISELKHKIQELSSSLKYRDRQLEEANKKISDMKAKVVMASHDSLTDIYKPKKLSNTIGLSSAIFSLSVFLPQVQTLVGSLGICGVIGSFVIWFIAVLWIFSWIRNIICNSCIRSIIDKIIVGTDLFQELEIIFPTSYSNPYFSETSLIKLVDRLMNKHFIHLLFFGKYNSIRRQIVEHIILELEHRCIIVDSQNNDMQRIFNIEHRGRMNLNPFLLVFLFIQITFQYLYK